MLSVSRPHDLILVIFTYFEEKDQKYFNKNSISPYLQILRYQHVFHIINLYTFTFLCESFIQMRICICESWELKHRLSCFHRIIIELNTILYFSPEYFTIDFRVCCLFSHIHHIIIQKKKKRFKYSFGNSQVKIMSWSSSIFPVS